MRGRVLVLAYHNIVPDGEIGGGDQANHLPLSRFSAHLAALRSTHEIIPLADALERPLSGMRPMAALTFDDAYSGAVTLGVTEVARQGLPATIFVCPGFVGGHTFWWDALASASGLDPRIRQTALTACRGVDAVVREWAADAGIRAWTPPGSCRTATEAELAHAASLPGITLGSHSWSHPNLTLLSTDELRAELERPLIWLRERFPQSRRWLAYPYGLQDSGVARAAAAAGYEAALCISGGWLTGDSERYVVPRMNVPRDLSAPGLVLRGSGLFAGRLT